MLCVLAWLFAFLWPFVGTRSEQATTFFEDTPEDAGAVFGASDGSVSVVMSIQSVSVPTQKEGEWVETRSGNGKRTLGSSIDEEDEGLMEETMKIVREQNSASSGSPPQQPPLVLPPIMDKALPPTNVLNSQPKKDPRVWVAAHDGNLADLEHWLSVGAPIE
eukprot:Cvel_14219.t2-p1 / transcript=Cvel_14219.t2 / gene=Cvel_14219 / organism=Chromera_velia_CCMP2878 / gene_product=Ankyrin-1, putative / transcript_product=Ankyrin-1, putative / location=Cvel_scaffold1003:5273-6475(+) / protein_length=161 / sequence_SO=supercontig / SO=protein_coding / is_pseudo=false